MNKSIIYTHRGISYTIRKWFIGLDCEFKNGIELVSEDPKMKDIELHLTILENKGRDYLYEDSQHSCNKGMSEAERERWLIEIATKDIDSIWERYNKLDEYIIKEIKRIIDRTFKFKEVMESIKEVK